MVFFDRFIKSENSELKSQKSIYLHIEFPIFGFKNEIFLLRVIIQVPILLIRLDNNSILFEINLNKTYFIIKPDSF
jgi:hypothetical protein